ncbi:hypothetical protein DAEQUDRAFT_734325 [Daedalea quercina L-15889]|uniref:DUF7726 domain-containing protein n=1 Tax=Daedalea quercina L-15889 TaxID=1314783 RepID=A0A165UD58_9APHY|nr:hypothetical protein DAEQUDRAFT_734325 [Daedalea quercina L-15889]
MPKRKSDVAGNDAFDASNASDVAASEDEQPKAKKARTSGLSDTAEASSLTAPAKAKSKGTKAKELAPSKNWWEIKLEGEDEDGGVPVYDDCNDIRRKIRALQKTPGFKIRFLRLYGLSPKKLRHLQVTHWLEQIGKINNNSYNRFNHRYPAVKASGPTGGAENGTYYAAYVYFEKVRIAEGKKKSAKRIRAEQESPAGLPLQDRRRMWVYGPA